MTRFNLIGLAIIVSLLASVPALRFGLHWRWLWAVSPVWISAIFVMMVIAAFFIALLTTDFDPD